MVDDTILPSQDLPLTMEDAQALYATIASGSKFRNFSLKPSCLIALKSFEPLVSCLPVDQFKKDIFGKTFTLPQNAFVGPDFDLLRKEHKARLDLLSITVALSALRTFGINFKTANAVSTLDAGSFSFFVGLQGFIDYAWHNAFVRFAEVRSELRKSAFKSPYGHQVSRLIYEDPFSTSLFSEKVVKEISNTLSLQSREWGDLVKLTPQAEAEHVKAKNKFINALTRPANQQGVKRSSSFRGKGNPKRFKRSFPDHMKTRPARGQKFRPGRGRRGQRGNRGRQNS